MLKIINDENIKIIQMPSNVAFDILSQFGFSSKNNIVNTFMTIPIIINDYLQDVIIITDTKFITLITNPPIEHKT